jgi:hypothetical protein
MTSFDTKSRWRRAKTGTAAFAVSSLPADVNAAKIDDISDELDTLPEAVGGESGKIGRQVKAAFNDDPEKRRAWYRRPPRVMFRWLKKAYHRFYPEPTPEEAREIEERKRQAEIFHAMRQDATAIRRLLVNGYKHMGIGHDKTKETKRDVVRFGKCLLSNDGAVLYYHVDYIPERKAPDDLCKQEVLNALSWSVGHPVHAQFLPEVGGKVIVSVERAGKNDIPTQILWRDMVKKIPAAAPGMTALWGQGRNGATEWAIINAHPHMLIAGTTGWGKTIYLHQMICTVIVRNTPNTLRVVMIDMKGTELNRYAGIPHLVTDIKDIDIELPDNGKEKLFHVCGPINGIAITLEEAAAAMEWVMSEHERRNTLFVKDPRHPRNVESYNRIHRKRQLPYIVVVIDELAQIMDQMDADDKQEKRIIKFCRKRIRKILSLGRSTGISFVGATQSLDRNTSGVGVAFKNNVAARVCFHSDITASIQAIGDGAASRLDVAGRAFIKTGGREYMEVQTPFITDADIFEAIAKARSGDTTMVFNSQLVTPEDILKWAIYDNEMRLKKDEVFNHFRSLIGYDDLVYHILPGMDGKIFDIDGASYKVIPGGGQKPRKIEPIEGDSPTPLPTATQEPTTPPAPAPPDTSLDVYEVHCKYCQAVYDPLDDHVCPECGAPTAAPEPTPEPKPVQMTSGIIHRIKNRKQP